MSNNEDDNFIIYDNTNGLHGRRIDILEYLYNDDIKCSTMIFGTGPVQKEKETTQGGVNKNGK